MISVLLFIELGPGPGTQKALWKCELWIGNRQVAQSHVTSPRVVGEGGGGLIRMELYNLWDKDLAVLRAPGLFLLASPWVLDCSSVI